MPSRQFAVTEQQWERFVECIGPTLGELLTAGILNEAADEVEFLGGRTPDDLRCRVDALEFTVEVKSAWRADDKGVIGHSPVRLTQRPDLVALFGKFDVRKSDGTVRRIAEDSLTIRDDRFFFLVPIDVIRQHSKVDGKSMGRSLISIDVVRPFSVDLSVGLTKTVLRSLLSDVSSDF